MDIQTHAPFATVDEFLRWCRSLEPLEEETLYKVPFHRRSIHIGLRPETVNNKTTYYHAHKDRQAETWIQTITPTWTNDCGVALLMHYSAGGGIRSHRDANGYGPTAWSFSSTPYTLKYAGGVFELDAGVVYSFNSKRYHSVPPLAGDRWCLVWWNIPQKNLHRIPEERLPPQKI